MVLDGNPLDLVERDLVPRAVVKLGGARTLMRRHGLCVFERAAALEVGCDPRGAERMATYPALHAEVGLAALDHAPSVDPVHRGHRKRSGAAGRRAEEEG